MTCFQYRDPLIGVLDYIAEVGFLCFIRSRPPRLATQKEMLGRKYDSHRPRE